MKSPLGAINTRGDSQADAGGLQIQCSTAVNVPPNHTMMLTIPPPVYGLFRYLYLTHIRGETAAPDEALLSLLFPGST